jgi:hypothetical protein
VRISELKRNRYGHGGIDIPTRKPPDDVTKEPWQVQGFDVYIRPSGNYKFVDLYDGEEIIAKINLWQEPDPELYQPVPGLEVLQSEVKRWYQGRGLGIEIYKSLILNNHVNLYSAGSHSVGARKLWVKLSNDSNLMVYATRKKLQQVALPQQVGDELAVKGWRLYGSEGTALVAVAAGSSAHHMLSKLVRNVVIQT